MPDSLTDTFPAKRRIHVGILGTQGIPAKYGGFETFAEELASRWSEDPGFDITVVCPGPRRPEQPTRLGRIHLGYVDQAHAGPVSNILFDVRSLWSHRQSFDVLYMLGFGAAFACFLPRLYGSKVWLNMDGLEWKRSKWNRMTRSYVRLMEWVSTWTATRLIADADAIRTYFHDTYGERVRCTFIPYGANFLEPHQLPPTLLPKNLQPEKYLLLVARPEPENQVLEVIQGFLRSRSSYPLVVVGNVHKPNAYVRTLLSHASERVRFIGGVYDKLQLAALRYHARAAFHGHTVGGTNPSLLEAIAAGRPIIAHNNPFNREVSGALAVYFDGPDDIPNIIDGEGFLPESPAIFRQQCLAHLRERYTWEGVTEAYKVLARQELGSR
jgi:glycosyltransferase involved in cell wall biosynthesis